MKTVTLIQNDKSIKKFVVSGIGEFLDIFIKYNNYPSENGFDPSIPHHYELNQTIILSSDTFEEIEAAFSK